MLRARAVSRWLWSTVPMRRALLQLEASVHRRAPVVRRASYGLHFAQPAFACHARAGLGAGCLLEEGATLKLPPCARGAELVLICWYSKANHCGCKRPLSSGVRTWCDVLAAASSDRPAPRASRGARVCDRRLWGGGASLELAARACCAALVAAGLCQLEEYCACEWPLSSAACPWCDVPAATSNSRPAPRATRSTYACARCLWGGGASLELATRACRAALVLVNRAHEQSTSTARGLRPWARACCATCQLRPPTPRDRHLPRSTSAFRCLWGGGEELDLLRARTVPCWLWSAYAN